MAKLNCPYCAYPLDTKAIFANCCVCIPDRKSFSFFCPQCKEHSEIMVENAELLIGGPDGFPEPSFLEQGRMLATGISVSWQKFEAVVRYETHEWKFGVTEYYRQTYSSEHKTESKKAN